MNEHNNHEKNIYNIPDINKKIFQLNWLKEKIVELNKNINEIIDILNIVFNNIKLYYNICNDYIKNYDMKKMNYEKAENINKIINEDILNDINDINNIINDNNINNKFKKIIEINNKIKKEEIILNENINNYNIKTKNYDKLEKLYKIINEDVLNDRIKIIKNDYYINNKQHIFQKNIILTQRSIKTITRFWWL